MRVLEELSEVDKEDLCCEVAGCENRADLYVTDDTVDGDGYICYSCNAENEEHNKIAAYDELIVQHNKLVKTILAIHKATICGPPNSLLSMIHISCDLVLGHSK